MLFFIPVLLFPYGAHSPRFQCPLLLRYAFLILHYYFYFYYYYYFYDYYHSYYYYTSGSIYTTSSPTTSIATPETAVSIILYIVFVLITLYGQFLMFTQL